MVSSKPFCIRNLQCSKPDYVTETTSVTSKDPIAFCPVWGPYINPASSWRSKMHLNCFTGVWAFTCTPVQLCSRRWLYCALHTLMPKTQWHHQGFSSAQAPASTCTSAPHCQVSPESCLHSVLLQTSALSWGELLSPEFFPHLLCPLFSFSDPAIGHTCLFPTL